MTSIIKLKIDIITTGVAAEILNNLVTKSHSYNDDRDINCEHQYRKTINAISLNNHRTSLTSVK